MDLNEIVAEMVASEEKCHRVLSRGLVLAFTPQNGIDVRDGARFVWSRLDDHPSEVEDKIVRKAVEKGMRLVESMIVTGGPTFRAPLTIRPGWGSSMLYWHWVSSSSLTSLKGKQRDRALEWIGLG